MYRLWINDQKASWIIVVEQKGTQQIRWYQTILTDDKTKIVGDHLIDEAIVDGYITIRIAKDY